MPPILALLRSRSSLILVAALALCIAGLWLRGNHYRDARDHWRSTATQQADATRAASAAAAQRAETARLETERRYAAHARKADYETPPAVADLRTTAARYADAHRLRAEAACRLPGSSAASAEAGPAPDRDRPGADPVAGYGVAETVAVPRSRYDELVENTLRLERVRAWGEGLIAEGLAVRVQETVQ